MATDGIWDARAEGLVDLFGWDGDAVMEGDSLILISEEDFVDGGIDGAFHTGVLLIFLGVILIAIASEFLLSMRISKKVTESLMGFEPDVFSAMYKVRDDILESLDEGVIAVDADSEVIFMNKAATEMIAGDGKEDSPESLGARLLSGAIGKGEKEVSIPVNLHNDVDIIMDRHPITEGAQGEALCPA